MSHLTLSRRFSLAALSLCATAQTTADMKPQKVGPNSYYVQGLAALGSPANQNFIMAAGGTARLIPASAEERFQLSAQHIREHWGPKTRGVLIASPNNPTGATISRPALQELIKEVRARDGFIIMDSAKGMDVTTVVGDSVSWLN